MSYVITPKDGWNYWFGYYDKPCISPDGYYCLAHRSTFNDRMPSSRDFIEVGYLHLDDQKFTKIGETNAWNWQQGAHLRWIENDHSLHIAYNIVVGKKVCCNIVDFEGNVVEVLPFGVVNSTNDGRISASVNFKVLNVTRPDYGIPHLGIPERISPFLFIHKVGAINIELDEKDFKPFLTDLEIVHSWTNHPIISPEGDKVIFLLRSLKTNNIVLTKLMEFNFQEGVLLEKFSGMVSHCSWLDNDTIVAWAGYRKVIGSSIMASRRVKILKKVFGVVKKMSRRFERMIKTKVVGDSYMVFGKHEISKLIATGGLGDGHCIRGNTDNKFISDTYPDSKGILKLFEYDIERKELLVLESFYHPNKFRDELRIDLHPRYCEALNAVFVDTWNGSNRVISKIQL